MSRTGLSVLPGPDPIYRRFAITIAPAALAERLRCQVTLHQLRVLKRRRGKLLRKGQAMTTKLDRRTSLKSGTPDLAGIASVLPTATTASMSETWARDLCAGSHPVFVLNTADYVYAGCKGRIYKLLAADGTLKLDVKLGRGEVRLVISGDGTRLFGGSDGQAWCVDTSNFDLLWRTKVDNHRALVNLLLSGNTLYTATHGNVYALDAGSGRLRARNALNGWGKGEVRMALAGDGSQLFAGVDGYVLGLSTVHLPQTNWETRLKHADFHPVTILTHGEAVYAAGNGHVFRLRSCGAVEAHGKLDVPGGHDVSMQLSKDGNALLLGTGGHALSIDAASLATLWKTNLSGRKGTPVSALARDGVLYAGNDGSFLRLNIATGTVTYRRSYGRTREAIGMALSPDGAHLRLGLRGDVHQTPAAGDLAAGWQAISANRQRRANESLASLFTAGVIPRTIESSFTLDGRDHVASASIAAAPKVRSGEAARAALEVPLNGRIAPGDVAFEGHVELTLDLQRIQAWIEEEQNHDLVIAIDLGSGRLFDAVDTSRLRVTAKEPLEVSIPALLDRLMNEAVSQIPSPLRFTVPKPLPGSWKGFTVRPFLMKVPGRPEDNFMGILFGRPGEPGSLALSPSILPGGSDRALVLGNRFLMESIKAGCAAFPESDQFRFRVSNAYPARVRNTRTVDLRENGFRLRFRKDDIQIFIDDGKLEAELRFRYKTAHMLTRSRLDLDTAASFTRKGGDLQITFEAGMHVPWGLFDVWQLPLLFVLRTLKLLPNLRDGKALISFPGFDVTGVNLPAYFHLTGKTKQVEAS